MDPSPTRWVAVLRRCAYMIGDQFLQYWPQCCVIHCVYIMGTSIRLSRIDQMVALCWGVLWCARMGRHRQWPEHGGIRRGVVAFAMDAPGGQEDPHRLLVTRLLESSYGRGLAGQVPLWITRRGAQIHQAPGLRMGVTVIVTPPPTCTFYKGNLE